MRLKCLVLAALVLSAGTVIDACSTTVNGQPSGGSTVSGPSPRPPSGNGSLASVDPCSLLTQQAAQQLVVIDGPMQPKVKDADLARVCVWKTDKAQFAIGFDFVRRYDDSAIAGVDKMQRLPLGGLPGVFGDNLGYNGSCLARVDAGSGQVVDGIVTANKTALIDSCALLKQVMELVIAQLPK